MVRARAHRKYIDASGASIKFRQAVQLRRGEVASVDPYCVLLEEQTGETAADQVAVFSKIGDRPFVGIDQPDAARAAAEYERVIDGPLWLPGSYPVDDPTGGTIIDAEPDLRSVYRIRTNRVDLEGETTDRGGSPLSRTLVVDGEG